MNKFTNFTTMSKSDFLEYIEKTLFQKMDDLKTWYNEYGCICNDTRDEISYINFIHCHLYEYTENQNFTILFYDINYEMMHNTNKPRYNNFIVLWDNGKIEIENGMNFDEIHFLNIATGEIENVKNNPRQNLDNEN